LVDGDDGCVGEDGEIFGGDLAEVISKDQRAFCCGPYLMFSSLLHEF
jgi:hypothetical protein